MRDYVTCVEACVSPLADEFARLNPKYTTVWWAQSASTNNSCDYAPAKGTRLRAALFKCSLATLSFSLIFNFTPKES